MALAVLAMLSRLVLAVLAVKSEVLVYRELAQTRVSGSEDGESDDDT